MRLLQQNIELPYQSIVVIDDLMQYYSMLEVVLFKHITGSFIYEDGTVRVNMHILSSEFEGSTYKYTCIPEATFNLINSVTEAVEGTFTVNGLLSRAGVKSAIVTDSLPSYWRIPSCKLTVLFDYLENYAVFSNGGCPKFYIDINGAVQCFDLKTVSNKVPEDIAVEVTEDYCEQDWILRYPGMVDMYVYSKDGVSKKKLTFEKGFGNGVCRVNDTTGHEASLMEAMLRNTFYERYYTARVIGTPNLFSTVFFGKNYRINGFGNYILLSRIMKVTPNAAPEIAVRFGGKYEDS